MRIVAGLLAGVAGAVAGWVIAAALGFWVAGLAGVSDLEGGRGMVAVFGIGPLGGLAGLLGGAVWALRRSDPQASRAAQLARLVAVLAAIAGLAAGGVWLRLATLDTYTDALPPVLEFELRVPAGVAAADVEVELHTDRNVGERVQPQPAGDAGALLAGRLDLAFKTRSRLLVVGTAGQPRRLFRLRLARDPAASAAFGDWQAPDFVDDPAAAQPQPAPAGDPFAIRYRVRRAGGE